MHALNANEEIIRQPKISARRRINWSSVNTVVFVASIHRTRRPNRPASESIEWTHKRKNSHYISMIR
ncbi:hypothetical protein D1AOALGA4SA_2913 [Olavius algarvensis Delta 1 endosymbiont]|nr:hypothetical protein D1AOALGA4SA_2913 [Olavius algarvensis Delta 1 endosymbiont]